jgi:hypothetical protein
MRALVLVCLASAACVAHADSCDTSSDDAAKKAYTAATGKPAPRCFERSTTFAGLVTVGGFANDRGCMWHGILYECRWNPSGVAAKVMARAGWAKASDARRGELARAWIREVEHLNIVEDQPERWDKGGKPWVAPSATREGERTRVRFWQRHPSGMLPQSDYSLLEIVFDASGVAGQAQQLDEVTIKLH